jgi:O-antigen ligase
LSLQRAQLGLLAALAAAVSVSIFAAELLLALSVLVFVARLVRGEARLVPTALDTPLAAFVVWTLLAASFATLPARSHEDAKKLVLFVVFYIAAEVLGRGPDRERVLGALLLGGLALATLTVLQHTFLGFDRLDRRPHGFLGHYMSAAGVTMGVLLLAVARLLHGPRGRPRARDAWLFALVVLAVSAVAASDALGGGRLATRVFVLALVVLAAAVALGRESVVGPALSFLPLATAPVAAWALVVSQTRSAWLGALVGLSALALLQKPRLLLALAGGVAALVLLHPASVAQRLTIEDASSVDRYYMWQAGIDMVLDRPVFGQGPGMILVVYPRYRWPEAPNHQQPHLHDNVLEIAAERGLPGLAFFLWCAAAVFARAWREARQARRAPPGEAWAALGALAVLGAVFVAGLFEYNLGDSEVLMLALLVTALPFALERERPAA